MQTTVNQRIKFIIDTSENGIASRFAKKIGVSPSVVAAYLPDSERQGEPGFSVLQKILNAYPQINVEWLIKGVEPMLQEVDKKEKGFNNSNYSQVNPTITVGGDKGSNIEFELLMCKQEVQNLRKELEKQENLNERLLKMLEQK